MTNETFPRLVKKVWGHELWWVNEPEYGCKTLGIDKGASGSLHYHPIKKETFIMVKGKIKLEYGDKEVILEAGYAPITILPGVRHRFTGLKNSIFLEVSTHHDDNDVVRLELSKT